MGRLVEKYRVADFACGTGLLLSSAYKQIIFNYEASSHGIRKTPANVLHRTMIEECLIGLDVLPIATHLAVSALAMTFPSQVFGRTNVKTMLEGKDYEYSRRGRKMRHYRLGSLDLISNETNATLTPSLEPVSGKSDDSGTEKPWSIDECHHRIGDKSCDLVVMNPPFTRSTNHGGEHQGDTVPALAAFGSSKSEQRAMAKLMAEKFRGTCAHGNAGLASYFIAIADKKVRDDGTLALVLPATISRGGSWKAVRNIIQNNYDVTVISIARLKIDVDSMSFSSDTGMAEVILVAKKRHNVENPRGTFISLYERPGSVLKAVHVGNTLNGISDADRLETGKGGTALYVGDVRVGTAMDCPLDGGWRFVNVVDPIVEYDAHALVYETSRVCENPGNIHMTELECIAKMGPVARDINEAGRGPFTKSGNGTDSRYPTLWNNVQSQQTKMIVPPDAHLIPKPDADRDHVAKAWATASRVHININPRLTANSLIAAYTKRVTVGGSSWPSLSMDKEIEKPFVTWCNSTFGILVFWSAGGKQQLGRIRTSRTALAELRVPDFGKMGKKTLAALGRIFDEHSDKKLDRIKNLWRDKVRMDIDARIAKILGIDLDLDELRLRLCMEPSVSGGEAEDALVKEYETRVTE